MQPDPYTEGAKAYHQNAARSDNPYDKSKTDSHGEWDAGYSNAKNGYTDEYGQPIFQEEDD